MSCECQLVASLPRKTRPVGAMTECIRNASEASIRKTDSLRTTTRNSVTRANCFFVFSEYKFGYPYLIKKVSSNVISFCCLIKIKTYIIYNLIIFCLTLRSIMFMLYSIILCYILLVSGRSGP